MDNALRMVIDAVLMQWDRALLFSVGLIPRFMRFSLLHRDSDWFCQFLLSHSGRALPTFDHVFAWSAMIGTWTAQGPLRCSELLFRRELTLWNRYASITWLHFG
ncbi:hypothetical protein VB716_07155 [Synechococcus sp. CCY9201]|uniref:hypothetical protein n=1 Tax=unclassified Synechococcus TaxID=2626047 RepID=UPI002AD43103|nr:MULTISPECIES: hypothetical protein [unclassified Synechococcus]MEA5424190.1 hypothetical protein [Synechococcus sp. CCY9202]MEA5474000.1 hypothetical protein [Synechococcus sp. CCY9201]